MRGFQLRVANLKKKVGNFVYVSSNDNDGQGIPKGRPNICPGSKRRSLLFPQSHQLRRKYLCKQIMRVES